MSGDNRSTCPTRSHARYQGPTEAAALWPPVIAPANSKFHPETAREKSTLRRSLRGVLFFCSVLRR